MSRNTDFNGKELESEGDRRYLDPLILTGCCSFYSDIYSLGLIGLGIIEHICDSDERFSCLKAIYCQCLSLDIQKRPSIEDIKKELQNLLNIT